MKAKKAKFILLLLSILVIADYLISFNPGNMLAIAGYKIITVPKEAIVIASVVLGVSSLIFLYRDLLNVHLFFKFLICIVVFAAVLICFRYICYLCGGFNLPVLSWVISTVLTFLCMYLVATSISLEGQVHF